MALVIKYLISELSVLNQSFYKDPRVQHLPLIGSPIPPLTVICFYVLLVTKWGPRWMSDRKPMNVTFLVQIYNVIQILLNSYAFSIGFWNSYGRGYLNFTCEPSNYHDTSSSQMYLLHASYIYYITKYLDLLDTIFFVLRKKNNQISFLHVYHHAIMVLAVWLYVTCLMGAHPTMLGIINAFVHTVMYAYYLLSTMNLKFDLIPWKKMITKIQITQFCYLVIHFSMPLLNNWCNLNFNLVNFIAVVQNIFMAAMFSDFYYKTYVKRNTSKRTLTFKN